MGYYGDVSKADIKAFKQQERLGDAISLFEQYWDIVDSVLSNPDKFTNDLLNEKMNE